MYVNPDSLRTPHPSAWPQHPFNDAPVTREESLPRYRIASDTGVRIPMRDGIILAADVFRPAAPGEKFPAVVAVSPYSRQLQRTDVAIGQNEAGLTEFWVPRGYVHVVVDVRGTNDSEGSWDMFGPTEQQDVAEAIEWVARQPWCTGKVGMVGCSYFGRSQVLVSGRAQPPSLTAIFPYDAATDAYRDSFFHGGIPADGFARSWLANINAYSLSSGRLKDPSGIRQHSQTIFGLRYPFDCEYFQERSSWPRLDKIAIPIYFGSDWEFFALHLRGAFSGWAGVSSTNKRMLVGPRPQPFRPLAAFHLEALRWYDHWLKGLDTGRARTAASSTSPAPMASAATRSSRPVTRPGTATRGSSTVRRPSRSRPRSPAPSPSRWWRSRRLRTPTGSSLSSTKPPKGARGASPRAGCARRTARWTPSARGAGSRGTRTPRPSR